MTTWLVRHITAASLVGVAVIAFVDHVTGVEITFVVMTYLAPISAVTWFRSRRHGLVLSALATSCAVLIVIDNVGLRISAVVFDGLGAFGMFAAITMVLDALRRHVERERQQRRLAVEQLRHAERLNVIGTLAAGVAHELGTPLNVISGAAELLDEGADDRVHQHASLILRQTEKITAIIRHLLDFGRRNGSTPDELDLDQEIRRSVELLAATARRRGVNVVFQPGSAAQRVRASSRELEQVVSNLMINGIQAMARGGWLRISTGVEHRGDIVYGTVAVSDEGGGIAQEHLPFIFDPFFTTKGVGEGTGLGLSVSYGIVSDWGGRIEVHSRPGQGSTFVVLIPAYAARGSSNQNRQPRPGGETTPTLPT
jgi:signal transduction histidine kinase